MGNRMGKKIALLVIGVALILCLVLARYADQRNDLPDQPSDPVSSETVSPSPSDDGDKPGELENGLGWG